MWRLLYLSPMLNFSNAIVLYTLFLTVPPSTVEVKEVMILSIGLMIEMYVLTRMSELLILISRNKGDLVPWSVRILAGITIAVCVLGVIRLFDLWGVLLLALDSA